MAEQIKFDRCLYPHFRFYMREVRTVVYSQFVGILQERDGSCHASLQDSQSCRCFGDKECILPGNNQARGFLAKQDPEAVSSHHHFSIKVLDGLEQKAKASAGAIYERKTLLVLEIMLEAMVDVVAEVGADAVSHGWEDAVEYAKKHDVPVYLQQGQETSGTLGDILEDLANERKKHMYMMSVDPEDAPDQPEMWTPRGTQRERLSFSLLLAATLLSELNTIVRINMVENRLFGMKSGGVYETPGGTILFGAVQELESLTLDRESIQLKDSLALKHQEAPSSLQFSHRPCSSKSICS
ncbi:hypothetical protein HID58_080541 [Brassica napus]|uniref:argininosuccinate synthase n=1 Tax=Brassica napus TaxID=3708 RepID=A0ABQ7Y561_BRANA|nr:hypothetical protein HID58_080541 [Brassica napus]